MSEQGFRFSLTNEEKNYLRELALASIRQEFDASAELPEPPTDKLRENYGVFVTLKIGGQLRGCIGHIWADEPVHENVANMAKQAAFSDPRFPPLGRTELEQIEIEISIMSPIEPCPDPEAVVPGRHGLVIQKGVHSGLLLPQVASEHNWDRETFLSQTCVKAGQPPNCWQSGKAQLFWFEAEVF
ncbi:MAG: AmmeMemoRadiSam system protein A [Desulfohalobiaceae bacterium]|nr:AmmeMemoRadiSam system protein A [Desulfohalobiaceae bacterium]